MTNARQPASDEDHRRGPRRRGEQLTAAIFDAVFAELEERGYAQLTMEAVAQRSRTSKASLYRRWPSRVELVIDATYSRLPPSEELVDTGDLRDDLNLAFWALASQFEGVVGIALRGLNAEALADPETADRVAASSRGLSRTSMKTIVDRATRRGELDGTRITSWRLEAVTAMMRSLILLGREPIGQGAIIEIIDEVVLPLLRAPLTGHGSEPG